MKIKKKNKKIYSLYSLESLIAFAKLFTLSYTFIKKSFQNIKILLYSPNPGHGCNSTIQGTVPRAPTPLTPTSNIFGNLSLEIYRLFQKHPTNTLHQSYHS